MNENDIVAAGVAGLAKALAKGRATALAAAKAYLSRIERFDTHLRAFVHVLGDSALKEARASDARRRAGKTRGPLDGVPVAIKDNIAVKGVATAAGIAALRGAIAQDDAEVVRRLRAGGAVILGTLNMHEGALGATTDNAAFGRCINPWKDGFTPGGSSGGSGAAVAAGLCAAALGTDTMGSIRIPAAYCGVAGFMATAGAVPTRGSVPCAWSLDHIGPLARSMEDCALVTRVLAGFDAATPESRTVPLRAPSKAKPRIGVVMDLTARCDAQTQDAFIAALKKLKPLATIAETALGLDVTALRLDGLVMAGAESTVFHRETLARDPGGFTEIYKKMIAYGASQPGERLAAAHLAARNAAVHARALFGGFDFLVLPSTPSAAFPHDSKVPVTQADMTCFANFARLPAASIPMGLTPDGLPLSLQIWGPEGSDAAVLAFAATAERRLGRLTPPGFS